MNRRQFLKWTAILLGCTAGCLGCRSLAIPSESEKAARIADVVSSQYERFSTPLGGGFNVVSSVLHLVIVREKGHDTSGVLYRLMGGHDTSLQTDLMEIYLLSYDLTSKEAVLKP